MSGPITKSAMKTYPDNTLNAGSTTVRLNGGIATQIAATNESRRSITLFHKGPSFPVYLNISSSVGGSNGGAGVGYVTKDNSRTIEGYGGPIYGIHNGVSGAYEYIGVLDIG
jgi:hypothetical protein